MIVKDEEKVIERCLRSCKDIIDTYCITDTGSTDNTKQAIKTFFDKNGIKGEIHDKPFVNFAESRNFAMQKAKDKADFCFTLDADEVLTVPKNFKIENLRKKLHKHDMASIEVHYGGTLYSRRSFWRNSKPFYYFGAVHEILMCDKPHVLTQIESLYVTPAKDGASWNQSMKDKYLGHAKLFLDYIEKNGKEPRHVFYCAQSFKDGEDNESAIKWYEERLRIHTGFFEERYWSQFMIAQLKWTLCKPVSEVAGEFMKCNELDTLRCEHLVNLRLMYERNEMKGCAKQIEYLIERYKGKNPYPNRVLFINPHCYL